MKHTIRFDVSDEHGGARLDELLALRLGWLSRMHIAALVARDCCTVNGIATHAGRRVSSGDVVEVTYDPDAPTAMTPEALPLDVIHEDAHLLVVDKPAGMLMHPTRGVHGGTLANRLVHHLNRVCIDDAATLRDPQNPATSSTTLDPNPRRAVVRPGLVHRLDRATSGLVAVAKTQRALSILSRHFHERKVEKRYLAVLDGRVREDEMIISAPVGRDAEEHPKWRVRADGKHAESVLRVLRRDGNRTLVEFAPLTGRTNQLRIHASHVGHPIVGDEWYGGAPHERLCLHAFRLAFNHPAGGAWIEFTSRLADFGGIDVSDIFDSRTLIRA